MNVLILIAMQTEAQPIIDAMGLQEQTESSKLPFRVFVSSSNQMNITLLTSKMDSVFAVDKVATQNAAVMAALGIYHFENIDIVLNAGTAGGFKKAGSKIGDVYLIRDFIYHDRRIPIPGFDRYGVGGYRLESIPDSLVSFTQATATTGNALSITESELHMLSGLAEGGPIVKDMEAAAIAEVCAQAGVPLFALKSITDIIDGNRPTVEEFLSNLHLASATLQEGLMNILQTLNSGDIKKIKWSRNHELIEKVLDSSL